MAERERKTFYDSGPPTACFIGCNVHLLVQIAHWPTARERLSAFRRYEDVGDDSLKFEGRSEWRRKWLSVTLSVADMLARSSSVLACMWFGVSVLLSTMFHFFPNGFGFKWFLLFSNYCFDDFLMTSVLLPLSAIRHECIIIQQPERPTCFEGSSRRMNA